MVPELLIDEARFPKTGTITPHADLITLAFLQNWRVTNQIGP